MTINLSATNEDFSIVTKGGGTVVVPSSQTSTYLALSGNYLTAEIEPAFAAISSIFLSSIPNDYKTYDETISSLSSDGYLMSSDMVSTIGDIQTSLFQNIQNPQASVRSIQETLISVLNILRKI